VDYTIKYALKFYYLQASIVNNGLVNFICKCDANTMIFFYQYNIEGPFPNHTREVSFALFKGKRFGCIVP